MPYNLLLLPLLGGYFFTHLTYRLRFRAYGLNSYRLLFNSALYGLGFAVASHLATRVGLAVKWLRPPIAVWKEFAPFDYSGTAIGSLVVAAAFTIVFNQIWDQDASSELAITKHGDSLMKLLYESMKDQKTVMLTLTDFKVYVGYVVLDLNLKPDMPYVSILPTASGYRDRETHRVHLTVSYGQTYQEIVEGTRNDVVIDDFQVLFPSSLIASARVFNINVYRDYFGDRPTVPKRSGRKGKKSKSSRRGRQ